MRIRQGRRNNVVEDDAPTTTISAQINWTVIITLVSALVLGVPMVLFFLRFLDALSEIHFIVIGAILGTIALVVVITFCWTRVVMAYSKLRSREDREEELSELRLLRAIQQGVTPNMSPTYQVTPGMDQTAIMDTIMELLRQQQPQIAPSTVIDFEQPVDYS